ncbi:MAG: SMP-30/gluconolactonase/LRE family protein [Pseudomonadota bacterium]
MTEGNACQDEGLVVFLECACELGEGPLWCPERQRLFWVDIEGQRIWCADPAGQAWAKPVVGPLGFLARGADDLLVTGVNRGFAWLDPETAALRSLGDPLLSAPGTMMNDGKADRGGRLVAGSKITGGDQPLGAAWSLSAGRCTPALNGFTVFNGPAFSPDGRRIYFADSPSGRIETATYDSESGAIGRRELFASLPDGFPDGMTVDRDGGLWNAVWDGWRIDRYLPDGTLDRSLPVPVPRPTSIAFGGGDYAEVFVTSARTGLSAGALADAPLSGAVFTGVPGEFGLPEARVRLPAESWGSA